MRHISRLLIASTSALLLVSSTALAGNPHFIKSQTSATLDGFELDVEFKEAGLESGSSVFIIVEADFVGTYQCVTKKKGSNPNDPKKTVEGTVTDSDEFDVDKNGNVTGTLTLSPIAANQAIDCPPGQNAVLSAVEYSNVRIVDQDNNVSLSLPGDFSAGAPVD